MFLSLPIHKTGWFWPYCLVLRQERRFLMPWWVLARKIDSLGYVGGIFDEFGSKIVPRWSARMFISLPIHKTGWFWSFCMVLRQERRFLIPWWVLARKIDSLGYVGGIFDEFGSKIVSRWSARMFISLPIHKTGCFWSFCLVLRQERRFLMPWWVLARKIDSFG